MSRYNQIKVIFFPAVSTKEFLLLWPVLCLVFNLGLYLDAQSEGQFIPRINIWSSWKMQVAINTNRIWMRKPLFRRKWSMALSEVHLRGA